MIYNIYSKVEFLQFYALKNELSCLKILKISQVGDGAQPPPQTPPHAERKNQYSGRTTFQQLAPPLHARTKSIPPRPNGQYPYGCQMKGMPESISKNKSIQLTLCVCVFRIRHRLDILN